MRPELHPACAAFPPLSDAELLALAEDIKINGLLEPITLMPGGSILDGRCRWDACEMAEVTPRTVVYDGVDPIRFVVAKNERRRHLSLAERAFVAETLASLVHGSNQYQKVETFKKVSSLTVCEAAELMNVGHASVSAARVLKQEGTAEIIDMVKAGNVGIQQAARAVKGTPKSVQQTWTTAKDVSKINQKKLKARENKPKPSPKEKKPNFTNRPMYYVNMTKLDIGTERIPDQPILLHPVHIEKLYKDHITVSVATTQIAAWHDRIEATAEEFAAALERMLAYRPVEGKTNGEEEDFAGKARKAMSFAEGKIDRLIDWITSIRTALEKVR